MQYAQLKQVLKGRLARFSASTSLDVHIVSELNAMMTEMEEEGFLPWFLEDTADLVLNPGYAQVNLPSDFLAEMLADSESLDTTFVRYKIPGETQYYPIMPMLTDPTFAVGVQAPVTNYGAPTRYFTNITEGIMRFTNIADKQYRIAYDYIKTSNRYTAEPAGTEEPQWAKYVPGYLIAMAGMRLATMYIKNKDAAQIFLADAQRERTKMVHRHTTVKEARINPNTEN